MLPFERLTRVSNIHLAKSEDILYSKLNIAGVISLRGHQTKTSWSVGIETDPVAKIRMIKCVQGFRAKLHLKDARIVSATARELGVPTPGFAPVEEALARLVEEGKGDLDHSALLLVAETLSGRNHG